MCKWRKQRCRRTVIRPWLLKTNRKVTPERVKRAALQRAPDHNANVKLTNASSRARLKRKVWTSLLWFRTALWPQLNVLFDHQKPWNTLSRCSRGWHHALWPSYVNCGRGGSLMCEEDWVQHRPCLSSGSRCKATKWREGKAPYTFEQRDRIWIRNKENPTVEMMLSNVESPNAKTSVLIVGMENSQSEVNEKLGEVSRDNPRGQMREGNSLSTPSRTMFMKRSRTCPTHPCHDT